MTRYAPGVFRSIREVTDQLTANRAHQNSPSYLLRPLSVLSPQAAGISEAAYYRSMVGSDMLHGGKLGEGKSGMLFFRSVDSR